MPPLFDPTFTPTAPLTNIPGQSLEQTNTSAQLLAAGANPSAITPQSLTKTNPLNIVGPIMPPVDTSGLSSFPELTMTPEQKKSSDLTNSTQGLYNSLVQKPADQTVANTTFGVDIAQANINDLGAQLTRIKNEAAAIDPLMRNDLLKNGTQLSSIYQGQRNERINQNAIEALGVSTLLAASQGQLANAQRMADKAVAAKYGPIEAQIAANTANLELIKNDPASTIAEKNQAQKLIDNQKLKAERVAEDKVNAAAIWKVATEASADSASFIPNATYRTATQALDAISKAPTKEEALSIATQAGLIKTTAPKIIGTAKTGYFTYDSATGQTERIGSTGSGITGSNGTTSGGTVGTVSTVGGKGVLVDGIKVNPTVAGDVTDVLSGRNTLYNIRQTMGRTNTAAAYMQQMRDSIRSIDPNFDFIASDAGGKFVSSTFYQRAISAITSVEPNIDTAVQLSDQVSRLGVAGVDKLLQEAAIQIGNQKVSNFHEAQNLIADEIGLALGQGSVSDMKLQLGFDVTDPSVRPEVFASNMALVKEFIENRKKALTEQRYSSSTTTGSTDNGLVTDIQKATKDKATYPTRESFIQHVHQLNPDMNINDIAKQVYSTWSDNTQR